MRGAVDESDIDVLVVGDHLGVAADFLEQIAEIDGLQIEPRGAGALPGNEQQVVNQNRKMLRLLDDALDRALVFRDALVGAAQRDLALAANDGQRRAELVADVGEEAAPRLVDLLQGLVGLTQFLGAFFHQRLEIGMRVLQGLLVGLEVPSHAIEALAEIGELVAAGDGDAMREIAFGELAGAAHELGKRRRADPAAGGRSARAWR